MVSWQSDRKSDVENLKCKEIVNSRSRILDSKSLRSFSEFKKTWDEILALIFSVQLNLSNQLKF